MQYGYEFHPKILTAPTSTIVDLADVKKHLRVPFPDDDDYLSALILAAQYHIEGWQGCSGRCFLTQTWKQSFGCWSTGKIYSPFPDLTGVVVKYDDEAGDEQTVSSSLHVNTDEYLCFKSTFTYPTLEDENPEPIRIEWTHGVSTIPEDVKLAVKMLIAHWYENREAILPNERRVELNNTPLAFQAIMARYRTGFAI